MVTPAYSVSGTIHGMPVQTQVQTPRILIVDADPDVLMALGHALRQQGYVVEGALSAAAALAAAARSFPAVVLLDANVPGTAGRCFARELRERGLASRIILLTRGAEGELWAGHVGADDYLPKPIPLAELLTTVAPFAD